MQTSQLHMSDTMLLFAGIGSVLVVASSIAALLKWRVAAGQPHSVIDNLVSRINAWWVMVIAIGIAFIFGKRGVPVQYFLIWIDWYGMYSIFIPVYAFLILPILSALAADTKRFLERTAKVQWGLMICVYCISHVPALLTLNIPGYESRHLLLIAFLVLVVQGSDVLQYIWGKLTGKRKVAPELSPSKTWEGLIGGVLSATA